VGLGNASAVTQIDHDYPWYHGRNQPEAVRTCGYQQEDEETMRFNIPGLGGRLRRARNGTGLSQEAIREQIGVSWMTVHRWRSLKPSLRHKQGPEEVTPQPALTRDEVPLSVCRKNAERI